MSMSITYEQAGTQRIHAFVKGYDQHLHMNYWDGSQWKWADQGTPGEVIKVDFEVGVITYEQTGVHRIYAFVVGDDGHLHVNYFNGLWHWADQGAPAGTGIDYSVGVITYEQAGVQRIYAFVMGDDGHLYVHYWNGSKWSWADQDAPAGTGIDYSIGVITFEKAGTQRIYAFVGAHYLGNVYVNYWDGSSWHWVDQGRPQGSTGMLNIESPLSVGGVITFEKAGTQRIYAFVVGNDNHLYMNYFDGSKWTWADRGVPPGTTMDYGAGTVRAGVIAFEKADTQRIYAFVVGNDNHLYMNYFDGSKWTWADRGVPTGTEVSSGLGATTYLDPGTGTQQIHVFVKGTDGYLYVNYWNSSQWKWRNQGKIPGTKLLYGVGAISDHDQKAYPTFFVGADKHLYMRFWDAPHGKWAWADQGTPPARTEIVWPPYMMVGYGGGVIAYQDPSTITGHMYAFVGGENGSLYAKSYTGFFGWIPAPWTDQGPPPGTTLDAGDFWVITFEKAGTQRIYAFVKGKDHHLHVNYFDGSQWHWADQGTPPFTTVDYGAGAVTIEQAGTRWIYVFIKGTDGHLYVNYWNGSKWTWVHLGAPPSTQVFTGAGAIGYLDPVTGTQRVYAFVVGNDSSLYMNLWDGSQWTWANQGTPSWTLAHGVGAVTIEQAGTRWIYVFVVGTDGHLYVNYWNGSKWTWHNQGVPPGASLFQGVGATAYLDPVTGTQRIYIPIVSSNGFLYVNYWDGAQWKWADGGLPP